MQTKLSSTLIDSEIQKTLEQNLKDRVLWDSIVSGLGARFSPKGKVSFILRYRFHGQIRTLTMGRYGRVTLAQAREQAKVHWGEIMKGTDPALVKKEARSGIFVKDLCAAYIEKAAPKKKTGHDDSLRIRNVIIPALGHRKLASLTYRDVVQFHQGIEKPIMANRCLSLLSKMFSLAKEWGYVDQTWQSPTVGVKKNPEKARSRYVREDEMPKLMAAINNVTDVHIRGAILISLFTGIRQGSIMSLTWDDLDLEAGLLFERNAKTAKKGEVVTHRLTSIAIKVFREIPRCTKDNYVFMNGFTFSGRDKHLRDTWRKVKVEAGIRETETDKLWLHDLRRTVGSWLVKNNYSTNVAKAALNHKSLVAAQRYQHINDGDLVIDAMEEITQQMTRQTNQHNETQSSTK